MGLLSWLLFGALVGWVASLIMKKNQRMGLLANIAVGLIGSALGGWLGSLLGFGSVDKFNISSFLTALVGAIVFLVIINFIRSSR